MTNRIKKFSPYIFILLLAFVLFGAKLFPYTGIKSRTLDFLSLPLKIIQFPLKEIKKIIFYRAIYSENFRLKNQIHALKRRLVNQEEIFQENSRLQRLLSFKNKSSFSLIAARVIAKDPSFWESVIIIDKGKNDGVAEFSAVITELGLAGQVIEAGKNTSKIRLVNDPNFSVAAIIQRSREEGIVSGSLSGTCRMKYLSLDSDVKTGDTVVTSGLSQRFLKGILIGKVFEADVDSSGLSKNCYIEPAVNFSQLEEVLIVIP